MAMLENEEKCILHTLLLLIYISSSYDATREDKIKMIFVNSPRNAGTAPSALGTAHWEGVSIRAFESFRGKSSSEAKRNEHSRFKMINDESKTTFFNKKLFICSKQ